MVPEPLSTDGHRDTVSTPEMHGDSGGKGGGKDGGKGGGKLHHAEPTLILPSPQESQDSSGHEA